MTGRIDVVITDGEIYRRFALFNWSKEDSELVFKLYDRDVHATYHIQNDVDDIPGYTHVKWGDSFTLSRGSGPPLERFYGWGRFGQMPSFVNKDEIRQTGLPIDKDEIDDDSILVNIQRCENHLNITPFLVSPEYPITKVLLRISYFANSPLDMKFEGIRIGQRPWVGVASIPDKINNSIFIPQMPRVRTLNNEFHTGQDKN